MKHFNARLSKALFLLFGILLVHQLRAQQPGNAAGFGGGQYAKVPFTPALNTPVFTVECWVKPAFNNGSYQAAISSRDMPFRGFIIYAATDNKWYFWTGDGSQWNDVGALGTIEYGRWIHLACTYDGTTMRFYVNGVLEGSKVCSYAPNFNRELRLAAGQNEISPNLLFNGSLDEVKVWNTARTAEQIRDGMRNTVNVSNPALVSYYDFNEGIAGGTNPSLNTLTDRAGHYNGSLFMFGTGNVSNYLRSYAMAVPQWKTPDNNTTSFILHWDTAAVDTVDYYILEVSTNSSFSSYVSGYNNLNIGNVSSYAVTGLTPETPYYCRLRARKNSMPNEGAYTYTLNVTTLSATPPVITSFDPVSAGAGDTVIIYGTHFRGTTVVTIADSTPGYFEVTSDTSIKALVLNGSNSNTIYISSPVGNSTLGGFTFIPTVPSVTSFSPDSVTIGDTITINGYGFTNVSDVSFGGTPAASYTVVSSTLILAVAGSGTSGNIQITNDVGTGTGPAIAIIPPPVITSYTPATPDYGDTVVITGTNLTGVYSVSFADSAAAYFTVVSDTEIRAVVSDAGTSGLMNVTNIWGTASTGFTFAFGNPKVLSFTPATAKSQRPVTIRGYGFTNVSDVTFGGTSATSFTVLSNRLIVAVIDEGASGDVVVTTTARSGTLGGFVFVESAMSITAVIPSSGLIGDTVTVTGQRFNPNAAQIVAYFGAVKATVVSASATEIKVIVPAGTTYQPLSITDTDKGLTVPAKTPFQIVTGSEALAELNTTTLPTSDFYFSGSPYFSVTGDLDGDGKLDLVSFDVNSAQLIFLRNTSVQGTLNNGSFAEEWWEYLSSSAGITLADLNGDGRPEVISTNGIYISIWRNLSTTGVLSFASRIDIFMGNNIADITTADLDNDGRIDLVCSESNSHNIAVLKNLYNSAAPSNLAFANPVRFAAGANPRDLVVEDMDGDGKQDIVVSSSAVAETRLFRNTSSIDSISIHSFATPFVVACPTALTSIAAGDLDGDGAAELITSQGSNNIAVFKNTSTPGSFDFDAHVDFEAPFNAYVSVTDIDGDGKPDLTAVGESDTYLGIYQNITDGHTINASSLVLNKIEMGVPSLMSATVGDFDGDGNRDVFYSTPYYYYMQSFLLRNTITPVKRTLIDSLTPQSGPAGTEVTLSGKGFSTTETNNAVYFGGVKAAVTSATEHTLTVTVPLGASYEPVSVVNIESGRIGYASEPFASTFNEAKGQPIGSNSWLMNCALPNPNPKYMASGDLDGDGKVDLAYTNAFMDELWITQQVSLDPLISASSFGAPFFLASGLGFRMDDLIIADVDGDGKPDIVASDVGFGKLVVFRNISSSGTLSAASFDVPVLFDVFPGVKLILKDLDLDGLPDIITYSNNAVKIFKNNAKPGGILPGAFTSVITIATTNAVSACAAEDMDGDGKPDLMIGEGVSNSVTLYRNNTSPGLIRSTLFIAEGSVTFASAPQILVAIDADKDGKKDLAYVVAGDQNVYVLQNIASPGNLSSPFGMQMSVAVGHTLDALSAGDIDGDGRPELVAGSATTGAITVLQNGSTQGSINSSSFTPGSVLQATYGADDLSVTDMNNDSMPDIAVVDLANSTVMIFTNNLCRVPQITSFTPSGSPGDTIVIHGRNFHFISELLIGDSVFTSFTTESDTLIRVVISVTGTSGIISVTNAAGTAVDSVFTFVPGAPVIYALSHTTRYEGDSVTITGAGFTGITDVSFGGVSAVSYTVISHTMIGATIGVGASGDVTVTNAESTGTISGFACLYYPPVITSVIPEKAAAGDTVVITGIRFGASIADNRVRFGAVTGTIIAAISTEISVIVPAGATYEPVSVLHVTGGVSGNAEKPFVLTFNEGIGQSFLSSSFAARDTRNTSNAGIPQVLMADLDGDGYSELIDVPSGADHITIFKNLGAAAVDPGVLFDVEFTVPMNGGNWVNEAAVGDVDGDGKPDIIVGGSNAYILLNTSSPGNLTASSFTLVDLGITAYHVAVEDLDEDGKPDIMLGGIASINVLRNLSTPGIVLLEPPVVFYSGSVENITTGDLDGDSKPDIIVSNSMAGSVSLFRNVSTAGIIDNASFEPRVVLLSAGSPTTTAVADIDGDHKPDLVVTSYWAYTTSIFRNIAGSGSFSASSFEPEAMIPGPNRPLSVDVADMDGDGRVDIVTTNDWASKFRVHRNIMTAPGSIGVASFDSPVEYNGIPETGAVVLGDLDGNGRTDIAVKSINGTVLGVYTNQLLPPPTIVSFTPDAAIDGSIVTITGTNFAAVTSVTIGGVEAGGFTVVSPTSIEATLAGATSGYVTVTTNAGAATSTMPFSIIAPLVTHTICGGDSIVYNGHSYTTQAVYYDTLQTINSFDSIIATDLTVNPVFNMNNPQVICDGGSYVHNGNTYTTTGIYIDTLSTINGCDSIIVTQLTVNPVYTINNPQVICDGGIYTHNGNDYTIAGTYIDTLHTVNGCDSIIVTELTVNPVYTINNPQIICDGGVYAHNGNSYTIAGTYNDTLHTVNGCDSIIVTELSVNPVYAINNPQIICDGGVYTHNSNNYTIAGTYNDTLHTVNGCDSIIVTELTVNPVYAINNPQVICDGGVYAHNGNSYTIAGIYNDTLHTVNGCDSIIVTELTVNPVYTINNSQVICDGSSYAFNGHIYTTAGNYNDTLHTVNGCDSIILTMLTVNPIFTISNPQVICNGGSYVHNGNSYTMAGTYNDTLHTINGCDSIIVTQLTVNPVYSVNNLQVICNGGSYVQNGNSYTIAGTYNDTLHTINGCDSIIITQLTVNPIYVTNNPQSVCFGNVYVFNGHTYSLAGTYNDTLHTINGCDSIITTMLTVNPVYSTNNLWTICNGNSYAFNGHIYATAGNYNDTLHTVNGCDSIIVTMLTVNPTYTSSNPRTICNGGSYSFNGHTYTTAGNYNDTLHTVSGCDSIIVTMLTVNPTYTSINPRTICNGGSYSFNGHTYTTAGNYNDTLHTVNACDSIIVTMLTVNPTYTSNNPRTICNGGSYSFNGHNYSTAGNYNDTLHTVSGCDSIIVTMLTVNPTYTSSNPRTICNGGSYSFNGHNYSTAGNYNDTLHTVSGCDSIIVTMLTVNPTYTSNNPRTICNGGSYSFNGHTYTTAGNYNDSLHTVNGCDSIIVTILIVNPAYASNNPQTICNGSSYAFNGHAYTATGIYNDTLYTVNGCDSIIITQLTVNPSYSISNPQTICSGNSYVFNGHTYLTAGNHYDTLQTISGCDSIIVTQLTVNPKPVTSAISGALNPQINTTETYSVVNTVTSSYTWVVSHGTQVSGANTNSIQVLWGNTVGTGSVKVVETSGDGCKGDTVFQSPNIVLPVKLIGFNATLHNQSVKLDWATASELNNDHFTIQRSTDGTSFESIGKVKGSGTINSIINYSYLDNVNSLLTTHHSLVYYRLIQTDFDGTQAISPLAVVNLEQMGKERKLTVQPNPFTDKAMLVVANPVETQATLRIMDGTGKVVEERSISLYKGETLIDLTDFARANHSGAYVVQVITGSEITTYRMMKAK